MSEDVTYFLVIPFNGWPSNWGHDHSKMKLYVSLTRAINAAHQRVEDERKSEMMGRVEHTETATDLFGEVQGHHYDDPLNLDLRYGVGDAVHWAYVYQVTLIETFYPHPDPWHEVETDTTWEE